LTVIMVIFDQNFLRHEDIRLAPSCGLRPFFPEETIEMNTDLDFIFKRRSIRKYIDKPVAAALLTDLLEAAMAAPSARATDPWHFIVVTARETLDKMAAALPNGKMLQTAPAAILACGDMTRALEGFESYMLQDVSAAVENILLAAQALGLGSCWLGVHPRRNRMDAIRNLFRLPDHIIPVAGIALGWPESTPDARTRYRAECVHPEAW
jgi:nitroreductase